MIMMTDPQIDELHAGPDEKVCIFCPCKPDISFCGKYVPGIELDDRIWYITDSDICEDCRNIAKSWRCPYCLDGFDAE